MSRTIILTEGSEIWGVGHMHRCSAFEAELISRHWIVEWLISGDKLADQFLQSRVGALCAWWESEDLAGQLKRYDLAIVDSYHAPLAAYQVIAGCVPDCLYLDDEARITYPEGYVLNSAPNAKNLSYHLNEGTKLLAGPKYHPLRPEFQVHFDRGIKDEVKKVLIVFGGTDLRHLSPLALQVARDMFPEAQICVVVADDKLTSKCRSVNADSVTIVGNQSAREMRGHMEEADLCISAAGQTLYEICSIGLPSVVIGVADNQRLSVDSFAEEKAISFVGWWDDDQLQEKLRDALEDVKDASVRASLSRAAQSLVNEQGVKNALAQVEGEQCSLA